MVSSRRTIRNFAGPAPPRSCSAVHVRRANGLRMEEPRAVGDPVHVETSFVRNLGGLICVRRGMPDRLMARRISNLNRAKTPPHPAYSGNDRAAPTADGPAGPSQSATSRMDSPSSLAKVKNPRSTAS